MISCIGTFNRYDFQSKRSWFCSFLLMWQSKLDLFQVPLRAVLCRFSRGTVLLSLLWIFSLGSRVWMIYDAFILCSSTTGLFCYFGIIFQKKMLFVVVIISLATRRPSLGFIIKVQLSHSLWLCFYYTNLVGLNLFSCNCWGKSTNDSDLWHKNIFIKISMLVNLVFFVINFAEITYSKTLHDAYF